MYVLFESHDLQYTSDLMNADADMVQAQLYH